MTRIIQDSDEEEEESLEENSESAMAALQVDNASFGVSDPTISSEHGTGSTESLKIAFQAAHRAQFPSQPSPLVPNIAQQQHHAPDASTLSQDHRSKRRKTSVETSSHPSPTMMSERRIPIKTYARYKTFHSPLLEQPCSAIPKQQAQDADTTWALDGTMRLDYEQHEPMALFPEASSTVPNATATQERLFAEVMAPEFLGLGGDVEVETTSYQPQGSVPWSEYLKTQSDITQTHPEPSLPTGQSSVSAKQQSESHTPPGSPHHSSQNRARSPKRSQRNLQGSLQPNGSPLRDEARPEDITKDPHMALDGNHTEYSNDKALSLKDSRHLPSKPDMSLDGVQHNEHVEDTVIVIVDTSNNELKTSRSDEELSAGLPPQDQYKPRPSRSRSLKCTTVDPIDYSVRPEKAAKKSTRRSRTTGGIKNFNAASTPDLIEHICDMGFTPATAQNALEKNNGDISATVDWLISKRLSDEQDELAPRRTERKPRKTSHAALSSTTVPSHNEDDGNPIISTKEDQSSTSVNAEETATTLSTEKQVRGRSEPGSSPKVVVLSPRTKETTRLSNVEALQTKTELSQRIDLPADTTERKVKRRKTAPDHPEAGPQEVEVAESVLPPVKKKGRGRPRKNPKPMAVEHESEDALLGRPEKEQDTNNHPIDKVDATNGAGLSEIKEMTEEASATTATAEGSIAPPELTPLPERSAVAKTPEKQKKPKNPAHSPLSKGKASYRVGLSKRARIAPLLKIMKK